MTKASKTICATFQNSGNKVVLFPIEESKCVPNWDALKAYYENILELIANKTILSASVVKEGGCGACVAKMSFGNGFGFDFNEISKELMFAPKAGYIVAEVSSVPENAIVLGEITDNEYFTINSHKVENEKLLKSFMGTLEKIFPNEADDAPMPREIPLCNEKYTASPAIKVAKPKVFIPAFPGTNCEIDTMRAFEKAGAEAEILVVKNLSQHDIEETIEAMEKAIRSSQIVMLPGGFSGGDEPEGSGKFIATTFRNPVIWEAVSDLLENRDGLMMGICNGFQALIKLGLVPYGKITTPKETDPTLTFNNIGRHVSRMAYTKITSTKSPWLSAVNAGDVFAVPVSHGEGRFVADDVALEALIKNGQVATQYCDPQGNIFAETTWNPNGSVCAIEGIISPDGRVLGKMGHSERKGDELYKNVPGLKDQFLFESGVKYFK